MEDFDDVSTDFQMKVDSAISKEIPISLITYVLTLNGEKKLKYIIQRILARYNRLDLAELLYTSSKELIVNATKAAIKRILFKESKLDIESPEDYAQGMESFHNSLSDKKFPFYREKMKEQGLEIKITFHYNEHRVILKVFNNFRLTDQEEKRVREKFRISRDFDNLFEFFMKFGDSTEGAGLGITMVEILVAQSGFDRHLFTIYSKKGVSQTVARVEIPLKEDYIPKRLKFAREQNVASDI
ncbi:hypothetical protein [Leptospira mayottensis]|uniref:GHKL domain protein n=2 Tax=Leptospira mayottensis TaxID=1137606 RepID=A0AA87SYE7_9LEPT|nr:hypothetical protein [Leptospira mayottensis]AXR60451.1 hypothetical protein DQM68_06865 [Leptospira mayottensis]AXR64267.1 hypothetical protein DQM28_08580 [Leptospira mayottensis]AXR67981.1 hypothetical protein DPV73_08080 [Leptospira mayottensis]AZQ03117.1 hypothetical protein LEP1GSC190_14820 [Leptospira mayottensis 200901116]EKS02059.1 GHKL domain protein [Leptospira mayottensis 200901122]